MMHAIEVFLLRIYMTIFKWVTAILPYKWPTVFEGPNSSLELVKYMAKQGHHRVLLVTDATLVKLGILQPILDQMAQSQISYAIYDGVEPNPTIAQIEEGYAILKQNDCQAILAVGGGSPIDAAKLIGARAKNNKPIAKMAGLFRVWKGMLPLFAVPTTAGTGSEATIAAVVTDPVARRKLPAMDLKLMPTAAALDSALMVGLPAHITAATGMDALTHAVEAYVSRNAMKKTDVKAVEATQLIMQHLETAVKDGHNLQARQAMARASHLAGIAFTQATVGYVHAIAHKFGALYHTPHGLANAIVMPHVLDYSLPNIAPRLADLARHCNIGDEGADDLHRAQAFIARIRAMNANFGIPEKLDALKPADIPEIAKSAIAEARFTYSVPRYMTRPVAENLIHNMVK